MGGGPRQEYNRLMDGRAAEQGLELTRARRSQLNASFRPTTGPQLMLDS